MSVAVTYGTGIAKNIVNIPLPEYRKTIIRALLAVLALRGAVLTQWIGEGELTPGLVETAFFAVFNAVAATGIYFYRK